MMQTNSSKSRPLSTTGLTFVVLSAMASVNCGDRSSKWNAAPPTAGAAQALALSNAVAIADPELHRVLCLKATSVSALNTLAIPVGKGLLSLTRAALADQVLALSAGSLERQGPDTEKPSLSLINSGKGAAAPTLFARWEFDDALTSLTLDPFGQWVVLSNADSSDEDSNLVVNPNEFVLIDISDRKSTPLTKTIRSFGGRPQRFTFTSALRLPDGSERRLLIVETESDLAVLDLSAPETSETTVRLPETAAGGVAQPAGVTFHDGLADDDTDARIAVRFAGSADVAIIELIADAERPFKLLPRLADAGGVPAAIRFVFTDQGVALAALLPNEAEAVLIDPNTTVAQHIKVPGSFSQFSLVTRDGAAADEALLWGPGANGVAFWSLGQTGAQAFRSVEGLDLSQGIERVLDVATKAERRILQGGTAGEFFVLDLEQRQIFPMLTREAEVELTVSADGARVWAHEASSSRFARVDLETLHPTSLELEHPVDALFDIKAQQGDNVLVALHLQGTFSATTLDADKPTGALPQLHPGLLLEGY